jgi:ribonuclease Z
MVKYLPLKLVFLGVGGWISDPRLGHTSILIAPSKNRALLLDAGEGVVRALYEHGFRVRDLEAIVLTHMHGDHVLGFPTLVMIAKNYEKTNLKAYIHRDHVENIKILLRTVGVDYENIALINSVKPGDSLYVGEFKLEFSESCHVQPTLAVRVDVEDICITYSSDTAPCNNIIKLAKNCNILVHEASGYDPLAHVYGHSTVEDALRVAIEAGVKKLILVHYYLEKPPLKAHIELGVDVYLAHLGEIITI